MANTEKELGAEPIAMAENTMPQQYPYVPRRKTIERGGAISVPYTEYFPKVQGGVCEFCGIIDNLQPATVQYMLCQHFKDIGELRCSYCEPAKNPTEVIYKSIMNIHGHPDNPDKLVVVCNDFKCSQKHEARFKISL